MPPLRADGEARGWDTGDEYLLRDLVREHSTRLQRFIVKHIGNTSEAEDLAQQAFVEAARSYGSFRGESQLSSWLYGIALNLVRNYLSRAPERRHDFVSDSVLEDHPSADLSPERIVEQNQMMALLQESLDELPENMRDILLMVGLDDISYEEAAALLTVPIGTVRSRLSRARTALREKMAQKGLRLDD
ncbi:RNA polymerase sigma factor [Achromobacter sp. Bel]|uniref:RNA polymerase sigma factor n=1 Tax=Achromobacter sp. Bel TaxID=2727415 RepID=UPI00145E8688|nr:RNA polymerase sigma factor [Achromobacter sp. Bel]NMK50022.1 RNA polymerase sigma factor [Achromobacter sp. Bel]